MKEKLLISLSTLPLIASGVFFGTDAAQAGLLVPPPPNSNISLSAVQAVNAGTFFFLRNADGSGLPAPAGTYSGFCNTPECAYFDFQPPAGQGFGNLFVPGVQPNPGGVFSAVLGTTVQIKDIILPFLGAPINNTNLNLVIPGGITAFVDLDPSGGNATDDTFNAKVLRSVVFENTGSGSTIEAAFDGEWIIDGVAYWGSFNFSQALSQTVDQVLNGTSTISGARQANGYFAVPSIQGNIVAGVPEPSTVVGLAVVAGSMFVGIKRKKQ
jgi:hypothetical protein